MISFNLKQAMILSLLIGFMLHPGIKTFAQNNQESEHFKLQVGQLDATNETVVITAVVLGTARHSAYDLLLEYQKPGTSEWVSTGVSFRNVKKGDPQGKSLPWKINIKSAKDIPWNTTGNISVRLRKTAHYKKASLLLPLVSTGVTLGLAGFGISQLSAAQNTFNGIDNATSATEGQDIVNQANSQDGLGKTMLVAAGVAGAVSLYFWYKNLIRGGGLTRVTAFQEKMPRFNLGYNPYYKTPVFGISIKF